MPNRILREGILSSEPVNSLSWAEEIFYRRLMSVVDDFGRFYASPKLLRAACYPLHIDKVSDSDIVKWLSVCETAALVRVYPALDGKRYLELLNFRQQRRAKESKFPAFDGAVSDACAADATQTPSTCTASAHLGVCGGEGVCVEDSVTNVTDANASEIGESPPDERDLIWTTGVRLITASGKSQAAARSFLGGQVKARGSPAVANAITQALINKPVEPMAYIAGVANENKPGRNPSQDRSAAGQVRAAVERSRQARTGQGASGNVVAVDGKPIRSQVG